MIIKQQYRCKGGLNTYIFGKREKDQQLFYDDANLAKLPLRRGDDALVPELAHAQLSIFEKITSGRRVVVAHMPCLVSCLEKEMFSPFPRTAGKRKPKKLTTSSNRTVLSLSPSRGV